VEWANNGEDVVYLVTTERTLNRKNLIL
jgi:hypothetical protein